MKKQVVFDVETTGLRAWRGDRIIEIGAVAMTDGFIDDEFHRLINVDRPILKAARKIHGITTEMLFGQPKAEEALTVFRQFIGRSVLVAHNAHFDVGFLTWECSRMGLSFSNRFICTLKLSRKLYLGLPNHRLETVAKHVLGTSLDKNRRHRALDDARLTARIWIEMRKE
jgi:DNA polymerase III subunit epsilon